MTLYLTLKAVFHTQLPEGMWLLQVGTLALSCRLPDRPRLTLDTYRRRVLPISCFIVILLFRRYQTGASPCIDVERGLDVARRDHWRDS